jgi:hypothetical protein
MLVELSALRTTGALVLLRVMSTFSGFRQTPFSHFEMRRSFVWVNYLPRTPHEFVCFPNPVHFHLQVCPPTTLQQTI